MRYKNDKNVQFVTRFVFQAQNAPKSVFCQAVSETWIICGKIHLSVWQQHLLTIPFIRGHSVHWHCWLVTSGVYKVLVEQFWKLTWS